MRRGLIFAGQQCSGVCAAIEADIDVAVARDFHRGDARSLSDCRDEIRRDFLRRLLQALRELERNGDGDLAEGSLTRLLQSEIGIDAELRAQAVAKRRMNLLLKVVEHGNLEYSDGLAKRLPLLDDHERVTRRSYKKMRVESRREAGGL